MKIRDKESAEKKSSELAKRLVDKGQGHKVSKMAIHAKKVLDRHERNIEDHMRRAPGKDANPDDLHSHKAKLEKMEKYHNYWSGVYSGFNNHDPFLDGLTKDSIKIKESIQKDNSMSDKTEQDVIVEAINSFIQTSINSDLTESENVEVIAKKGKHTLSRITRKNGTGYYKLDDEWRADYPIHYGHIDKVAFDNPEYFPKTVVSWASDKIRKHVKKSKK
jgi:hypothetical protein